MSSEAHVAAFFCLRTPLLPFSRYLGWTSRGGASSLREGLLLELRDPAVREALYVASPSLCAALPAWERDPEANEKTERALVKYFARMSSRATPFGLFAGYGVGDIGASTRLFVPDRAQQRRATRLDSAYLALLARRFEQAHATSPSATLRLSSSAYRLAGVMRYAAGRLENNGMHYELKEVVVDDVLERVMHHAQSGCSAAALVVVLREAVPDASDEEAREFLRTLVDQQVLVSDLAATLTGPDPLGALRDSLRRADVEPAVATTLDGMGRALANLDAAGLGQPALAYEDLAVALEAALGPIDRAQLFQVDLMKATPQLSLGQNVVAEIYRAARVLTRLSPSAEGGRLRLFAEDFAQRFEGREVPLAEALDDELGVGFSDGDAYASEPSPLLEDIALAAESVPTSRWEPQHAWWLRRLAGAWSRGEREVELTDEDLDALEPPKPADMPHAFTACASVAADAEADLAAGRFRVHLRAVWGGTGGAMLGRFCLSDPALTLRVRGLLRREEALRPDAIHAEIVHLPEGRHGNVLLRPVLRSHEIPFLGHSGAPAEAQLGLNDLLVSVVDGRVVLRSRSLDREVLPHLTTAHNYGDSQNLATYRFLCSVATQGNAAVQWSWGPLADAEFLPRVVHGRTVLAPMQWTLRSTRLKALAASAAQTRFEATQRLRAELRLPRFVALEEGDNVLPVDLDNALSVEAFVQLVGRRKDAKLVELLPAPDELCASGPEGRFAHELVVPFVADAPLAAAPGREAAAPAPLAAAPTALTRSFPPGSEWLYVKLYTGPTTADRILREQVSPLVDRLARAGDVDRWFFLRYGDPGFHLRLRFHGEPGRLRADVQPRVDALVADLMASGECWRYTVETYEQEVERYGGAAGMTVCEEIFSADSAAVLRLLELSAGDRGAAARWQLALVGVDRLLADLGFAPAERAALARAQAVGLALEHQASDALKHSIAKRFRRESKRLDALLVDEQLDDDWAKAGREILEERSALVRPLAGALRAGANASLAAVASSLVHMHINRMLRSAPRAQELVLLDFLARLHEGRLARTRKT